MPYFTSSTKLVVPSLPEASSRIYTAGETVRGSVELSLAGKEGEGPTIQELTVSLRCHQVSTYLVHYGQGTGESTGKRGEQTWWAEELELMIPPLPPSSLDPSRPTGSQTTGWKQSSWYDSPPSCLSLLSLALTPLFPSSAALQLEQDVVLFTASASQPLGGPSELIRHFPFEFTLPPLNYNLPSTFQGGRRSSNIEGGDVGKIDCALPPPRLSPAKRVGSERSQAHNRAGSSLFRPCSGRIGFIKVTGRKDKTFSINERYKLPFVYMYVSSRLLYSELKIQVTHAQSLVGGLGAPLHST